MVGDAGAREELHRLAHSMGSSALIYGYPGLSHAARTLEALCDQAVVDVGQPLRLLIEEARKVADGAKP